MADSCKSSIRKIGAKLQKACNNMSEEMREINRIRKTERRVQI